MATYTFDKIEYGSNIYKVNDSGALQLTGGQVTGPVTFGDTISIDSATVGDLLVNGSSNFTNGVKASSYNGGHPTYFVKGTQTASTNVWTGNLPSEVTSYYDGLTVDYLLPYAGTSTAATLNLSGLGAKPVYVGNTATSGVTTHYPANVVMHLTYVIASNFNSGNGCWKVTTYQNSTYYYTTVYCTTAGITAAKVGSTSWYKLQTGYFAFSLANANTYAGAITLNINSKGAKPIYINGAASSTSNYTLPEGQYIGYYDGANYYFRTDGKLNGQFVGPLTGTASGNLTSSSSLNAAKLTGTIPASCYTNTTYESKAAASGGTDVSLCTTGEKYTWNSKTSNTGTITKVTTTAGAHTAINVTSGAVSFNVPTTAAHVGAVPTSRTVNSKALSSNITLDAADVGAVPDCTIGLYNGNAGNPNPIRFLDVNYTNANSENGVLIKVTMRCGHGNGVSYNFLQDVFISVSYTGTVSVDIYRYYAQSITYDNTTHYYGDIFYTIDTTNKIVTFYTLMGQYSTVYSSSFRRMNSSSGGAITQYTSATKYSSGTKTYGHVYMIGGGIVTTTATLAVDNWTIVEEGDVLYTQSVTVNGVTADNIVFVSPDVDSLDVYRRNRCHCVSQSLNTLVFKSLLPDIALTVNIAIM